MLKNLIATDRRNTLDIPVIVGATGATQILKNGTVITIDGVRGKVYGGVAKII